MKKVILLMVSVLLVALVAVLGCAQPAAPGATPTEPAKVMKWNLQWHIPLGDALGTKAGQTATELMTTASNGRLVVTYHSGGAVVPATKEIDGLIDGSLDIAITGPAFHKHLFPAAGLFSNQMGGLTQLQQMLWYTGGDGAELAQEMYGQVNLHYVSFFASNVPEIWLSSAKPVATLADMKGYNMRVLGDAADVLAKMGVNTVMLPGGEVYESVQRGILDGFDYADARTNWEMGFQEVIKYMYMSPSRAPTDTNIVLINKDKWAELPDDLKAILETAGQHPMANYMAKQIALLGEATDKFRDYGTIIEPLPEEIDQEFIRLATEYYDEQAAADPFAAKVIKSIREWKAVCEEQGVR